MKKIIAVIMMLMLLVPVAVMLTTDGQILEIGENRTREQRPALSQAYTAVLDDGEYCESFSAYFNDNFGMRDLLIRTKNQIKYTVFDVANGVYIGDENYLVYRSTVDGQKACDDMTEHELYYFGGNIGNAEQLLEAKGIEFYVMICPLKNTAMPEKFESIPADRGDETSYDVVTDYLSEAFPENYICVTDALAEANEIAPTYYKTDFHWDNFGAAAGYSVLVNRIAGDEIFDFTDLNIYSFEFQGTQLNNFAILENISETAYGADIKGEHTSVVTDVSLGSIPQASMYIVNTADAPLGSLLIIGDSFSNYITKYNPGICECFSEVYYVNMNDRNYTSLLSSLTDEQVDYVVFETIETAVPDCSERLMEMMK